MRRLKVALLIFIIIVTVFVYLFFFVPCRPIDLKFNMEFQKSDKIENQSELIVEDLSNKDEFLWSHDIDTFVDEGKINISADKKIMDFTMKVSKQYARCDFNDNYTVLNPQYLSIILDGERFLPNINEGDENLFEYKINFNGEDKKTYILELNYEGKFKTKREINVKWIGIKN